MVRHDGGPSDAAGTAPVMGGTGRREASITSQERKGITASWSDAPQSAPGRPQGPPLVRRGRRRRFPTGPLSWGARSMQCFHSDASGHGAKVVATNHVTFGNCQHAVTVTLSQDPAAL